MIEREAVLAARGLVVGYGDQAVLSGVDFTLYRGEVVALLGPNGCGKSTLVKGILGVARVFDGEVVVLGGSTRDPASRARIGYVPQRVTVAGGLPVTVRESVTAGRVPRAGVFRRRRRADAEAVAHALATVDLSDRASDRLSELSGGQQRRVLIARALAGSPKILIMDEPMAGVDHANQKLLAATLERLVDEGLTVLLVLHEIGPLEPLITRVVALSEGRVVYSGPPRDVDIHYHDLADHEHGSSAPPADGMRLVEPFSEG